MNRTRQLKVLLTDLEYEALKAKASIQGMNVSDYVRHTVLGTQETSVGALRAELRAQDTRIAQLESIVKQAEIEELLRLDEDLNKDYWMT